MDFQTPSGNGRHPIVLVVFAANDLAASTAFYRSVFGWQLQPVSPELTAIVAPAGAAAALRANVPAGFPGTVPYIRVDNVEQALARITAGGASVERAPWQLPMVGTLARFHDPGGTLYGLTDTLPPAPLQPMPIPLGSNPKPPAGALCSLEMFARDGAATAAFFAEQFGWGTQPTMPQYVAWHPGAGAGGVFQSHTPSLPAVAYVYAADVDATMHVIEREGGKRIGDPGRVPGAGCFGYFTDPSGTTVGLIGP